MSDLSQRRPAHVITGFLGAGKTTVLNRLIRERLPERMLVIENEVGSVNLDSEWLVEGVQDVLELTAGCLCCSLNEGLVELLAEAHARRDTYDRLVIETTGVADPESIVQPFWQHPAVARHFDLRQVICVVDALNIRQWLADTEEARRQISFADVLLLHKIDLVSPEEAATLRQELMAINPFAQVFTGAQGDFPFEAVLAVHAQRGAAAVEQTQALATDSSHHHHDIHTFTLSYQQPFDLPRLRQELSRLLQVNRHQIYRIKGLIEARHEPRQLLLQTVSRTLDLSEGAVWPTSDEVRTSKIVVIGKGIEAKAMDRVFRRALR
jgi:G3E family GTPase